MSRGARSIAGAIVVAALLAWAPPLAAQEAEPSLAAVRAQAEAGDSDAQLDLAGRLMMENSEAELVEARRWLRLAMEAGNVEAKNAYAGLLIYGDGGPADEAEGRRLLLEAAAEGSVGAHLTLGAAYGSGSGGFPRDPVRALTHVRAAAESTARGFDLAQWQLGMMYLQGVGTPADPAQAYRWIARAADNGSVHGMISRAVMLATGEGVAEDDVAARIWYQRAATSGDVNFSHALRGLGAMLVTGEGGEADVPRGIAYLRIARADNDPNARALLDDWRDLITPEIDREARRIANEWIAEHLLADDRPGRE